MAGTTTWKRRLVRLTIAFTSGMTGLAVLALGSLGGTDLGAAGAPTAPSTVVILIPGFGTSLPSSSYDPLTGGSPALTQVEADFDPQNEPPTCDAVPNLTTTLTNEGALILPFSYNGATLSGTANNPMLTVDAYGDSIPGNTPSETVPATLVPLVAAEVQGVHGLWPKAHVLVVGHSEGGFVAESYFASNQFSATTDPEVAGIFSLDSPINGVENTTKAAALLKAIGVPTSQQLLQLFQANWTDSQNGAAIDASVLAKENGTALYVPVGTPNDGVYTNTDGSANPLVSQVLVDATGQPVFGSGSPNFLDPAMLAKVGIDQPMKVLESHQCVMDNAAVIAQIAARVSNPVPPVIPSGPTDAGYREVASDGGIFAFGNAPFYGSEGGHPLDAPVVGTAATPTGGGYWEVAADGGIFSFGDAPFFGSMGGTALDKPIVGMTATSDGQGYWEVASDGGVFAFGDAQYFGSMGGQPLTQPVVGIVANPDGQGYWEVAADGGIFAFGDAQYFGSMGGQPLNAKVVGVEATPTGDGYWEVASDGGIFAFGDARFFGSMGGKPLDRPVVGIDGTPNGLGYWEVASDGGIFAFGSATYDGSMGGRPLNSPVVGLSGATTS